MIISLDALSGLKEENIIFVVGTFDILHVGHIHFLEEAKKAVPHHKLLVGIIPDKVVRERKGSGRPVTGEQERAEIVGALVVTDYVVVLSDNELGKSAQEIISIVKPAFAAISRDDWEKRTEDWDVSGTKLVLIDKLPEYSTTKIVHRIGEMR